MYLEQLTPFPVELGNRLEWKMTPRGGKSYDNLAGVNILLNGEVIGSWNTECGSYIKASQPLKALTACEVGRGHQLSFYFTPIRDHFGHNIQIVFFPNVAAAFSHMGQKLLNATVSITKQPSFLTMSLTLEREPDYVHRAPSALNLAPPIFLDGSMAKLECKTDGALPPAPITFSIVCNTPPRAAVEQERQAKVQVGYPYEVSYSFYHFRSPPTDEELAERMAIGYAQSILEESRIASSQDNLTLSASIPITNKAHDCSLHCRLMGKEKQIRLIVYCKLCQC